jgi:hypothetical protein
MLCAVNLEMAHSGNLNVRKYSSERRDLNSGPLAPMQFLLQCRMTTCIHAGTQSGFRRIIRQPDRSAKAPAVLHPISLQTWRGFRSKSSETPSANLSTHTQNSQRGESTMNTALKGQ